MNLRTDRQMMTTFNAISLTDIIFLLLIFFLVATRFAEEEREMDIVLPEASAAKPLIAEPKQLFVNIDQQGQFFLNGEQLDVPRLEQALLQAWTNNPGRQEVIIRGDRHTEWQNVAVAMNACNKANIRDYKAAIAD